VTSVFIVVGVQQAPVVGTAKDLQEKR